MTEPYSHAERIACRTKRRYPTKSKAKDALKEMRKRPHGRHLEIYECWFCKEFHLGNPPGHQTYYRSGRPSTIPSPNRKEPTA